MRADRSGSSGPAVLPVRLFLGWLLIALAAACTPLSQQLDEAAARSGLQPVVLPGSDYPLYSYQRRQRGHHALVIIEGDGRPWRAGGRVVAPDPTPASPQALHWLGHTTGPALYLGRPCYGNPQTPGCEPMLWTYSRYSTVVVDNMALGLTHWLQENPEIESITLAGYSGGGVLALLLGERDLPIRRVIALSSPVDTHRWADHHGYGRLFDSLNPAAIHSWRNDRERHLYFGARDRRVPPALFADAVERIPGAQLHIIEEQGHQCCAPAIWLSHPAP
ncbi:alpha/beta fold hydrolase [Halopseudomonas bauzanensis]|uniref:alpha/beta fold hydrolase n=1 Tax=Halopseudomonas bauzanensis TaxID=653930 RepID=UPI0035243E74